MHSTARRAGSLWRRSSSHGLPNRYTSSISSLHGSVNEDACAKRKEPFRDPTFDNTLDDAIASKFGVDAICKPPHQSLHKAILAGEVTLSPSQRIRKNGKVITTFIMTTGGMWRLPIPSKTVAASEDDCTDPCLQYHKIAIHDEGLGKLAVQTLRRGMQVYVEGELETRVFNDGDTGAVKRDQEIAVYDTGQIVAWTEKGPMPIEHT